MTLASRVWEPALADAADLAERVIAAARAAREEERDAVIVKLLQRAIEDGRSSARRYLETGPPLSEARLGIHCAHALAHAMDGIVLALYRCVTEVMFLRANPTSAERIAVIAIGGYGRGTLAPFSDIDLMFLLPAKRAPWGEQVIETMVRILWSLGLKVGHAARTVPEALALAKREMTIRTSLLDARLLAGHDRLFKEFQRRFSGEIVRTSASEFISAKLEERRSRHDRFGNTRYAVEPNLKEGKGGLRDLDTLSWLGNYVFEAPSAKRLAQEGVLTGEEEASFEAAEAFLWEVRCRLHFIAGRAEEKLSFDRQLDLAKAFGFKGTAGTREVESFMRRYFLVARDVGNLTRIVVQALEQKQRKSWTLAQMPMSFERPRQVGDSFKLEGGRLDIAHERVFEEDPVDLLRLFHVAAAERCRIHPRALRLAAQSTRLIDDRLHAVPEANRLFLEILTSRNDPERILRRMNESGVLGAFIPDFGRIVAMMQFNMYHRFTVDEHLIRAIGHLAALERGELAKEHPLSHALIQKLQSRRVLYVAVFLHDIAKGRAGDHSEIGAEIARTLGARLGFSPSEIETAAWLVENHLVFSNYAQSRDPSDAKTIADFVEIVQSLERLKLLLILTVVDIRAVGPGVWNAWKGELMRTLYHQAETALTGGHARKDEARVLERQDALRGRLGDWPGEKIAQAVARQSSAYWLGLDTETQVLQARLAEQAAADPGATAFAFAHDAFRSVTALSVVTPDAPGLFAKLTGAISSFGLSIQDAKAFTARDGTAFDVFYIQDWEGRPLSEARDMVRLEQRLRASLEGRFDPAASVKRALPPREQAFSVEPQVAVDNEASDLLTVIEVEARDRPGLLYDLSRTLMEERLRISSAHIATFGEKAVDVFYVKDAFGLKLAGEARIARVRGRLLAAVADGHPSTGSG